MLTARDSVDDRVRGLEAGADDYLVKPFAFRELVARIRAVTRRHQPPPPAVVEVGDLRLDADAWTVTIAGQPVAMTPKEFAILELLMQNAGRLLSRSQIEEHVWDTDLHTESNLLEVYIARLRRKLAAGGATDLITIDADGVVIAGEWDVTPAVHIHTELHRARPDATVVIHGHPYYATLLGGLGIAPEIIHQNSSIFARDIAFVDEYDGLIGNADAGAALAERIGTATGVVLANHGAIVTGRTIAEACYQAVTFERMCKFYYDSLLAPQKPRILPEDAALAIKPHLKQGCPPVFWDGAVRQLLRSEPETLS